MIGIDDFEQTVTQFDPVDIADRALEDRFLNALAVILTGAGDPPEASGAVQVGSTDVVDYQDAHGVIGREGGRSGVSGRHLAVAMCG